MLLAAQVLLLRTAMHRDLCLLEARDAARRKAHEEAAVAVAGRAAAFQKWCQHKASLRAAAAANALLMAPWAKWEPSILELFQAVFGNFWPIRKEKAHVNMHLLAHWSFRKEHRGLREPTQDGSEEAALVDSLQPLIFHTF